MKNPEEFRKILEEIENSKGHKIDSAAYSLEVSFKIMVANFGYLKKAVGIVPTFSVDEVVKKDKYMIEVTRCFVNFLGSAGAFKDHTRRFIKKIYGSTEEALGGKYQEKINNEFLNDPLAQFIEALRNYYLHTELPPLGIQSTFSKGDDKMKSDFVLFLDKIDTKDYPKAKSFIENQGKDTASILELAEKYVYKTMFPWIMKEQGEFHKDDFEELENLKKKARDLMSE